MKHHESFEIIPVWKEAKELALQVYKATQHELFSEDNQLKDLMRRAAISVASNIAEGFEMRTKQELLQLLFIAKGTIGELRSHLVIAKDIGYIAEEDFQFLYDACIHVAQQISAVINYLRTSHAKGQHIIHKEDKYKKEFLAFWQGYHKLN